MALSRSMGQTLEIAFVVQMFSGIFGLCCFGGSTKQVKANHLQEVFPGELFVPMVISALYLIRYESSS